MSKGEVKKIVKRYAAQLKTADFAFDAIYLFGSYANGQPGKWSDIDVAVVTDKIKKDWDKNISLLWKMRTDIDDRIEPHGLTLEEFNNGLSPMANEIRRTGVRIV